MGQWNLKFHFSSSENFYPNGFHDLCKCGILLWYRAICEGGSRNRYGRTYFAGVPFEEKEEFAIPFKEHGLDLISLIAPTSHERIAIIAKEVEGFGISGPKQAKKMAAQSDGVIVGSAIVKLCEKYGADCVPHISTFVKEMKDAIR